MRFENIGVGYCGIEGLRLRESAGLVRVFRYLAISFYGMGFLLYVYIFMVFQMICMCFNIKLIKFDQNMLSVEKAEAHRTPTGPPGSLRWG